MSELIERIMRPHVLRDRLHPPPQPRQVKLTGNLLFERIMVRKKLAVIEIQLMETILYLRREVKFIEHLPRCWTCRMELQLDVERYLGSRSPWYLDRQASEYLEEVSGCPKESDYKIGNYWEQAEHFRKYGNTDTGDNTEQFIMDRAKWAYKIIGGKIRTARQMLLLVRNWNFSKAQTREFQWLYNKLEMYGIREII